MNVTTTETAQVARAATSGTTLTIDRGMVSLRSHYLPVLVEAQCAYDLAFRIARRTKRDIGAAIHLCTLARLGRDEAVERIVMRGGLLHIGAPAALKTLH